MNTDALPDSLTEHVLQTFAREAGLDREALHLDMRAEELGLGSLDLTLVLFEIEDKLGIRLPDFPAGAQQLTLRELLAQARPTAAASSAAATPVGPGTGHGHGHGHGPATGHGPGADPGTATA